jgi:uncharacterized membrane protein YeiB
MWQGLLSVATGEVKAEAQLIVRRAVSVLVFGLIAAVLLLFAVAALLVAIFSALAPEHGPVIAALLVAALALVLALAALIALKVGSSPPARKPASAAMPGFSLADAAQGAGPLNLVMGALILGLIIGRRI